MDSYESTLKRHLYEAGGKRFLNKNVFFAGFVRSVYERFPDASFDDLIRRANPWAFARWCQDVVLDEIVFR